MPFPEPVSWDRKDIYRDRRPVKSEPLGSSPVASRWNRDSPSFNYRGNHHAGGPREFSRRGFTDYRRPPGRGRQQSDWHMFPEESGYGYMPSRSCERVVEDRGYWTSSSSRVDGRYRSGMDYYKVKGYQKDWEGPNWQQNNSSSAVSTGKPFNGSPVYYGGKPCNGFSDMPVERRHNGMYPGFGVERHFSGSPVVSNGRPSNGFSGSSVEKTRNGFSPRHGLSPRNASDRPFSLSSAVSGDKPCFGYPYTSIEKTRNGFSCPSVLKTHNRNTPSIATERPVSSGDKISDAFCYSPGLKGSNKFSPRITADRSNHVSPDISGSCFVPFNDAIERSHDGSPDARTEKAVNGFSSGVSAEKPSKFPSSISKDKPNIGLSGASVEKTPTNISSILADGDMLNHKASDISIADISNRLPLSSAAESACHGLPVASEEKPCNRIVGASSANICDGKAGSVVIDPPQVNTDGKLSKDEHASDCLQLNAGCKNKWPEPLKHQHELEAGEIDGSCNVSTNEKENFLGADWKPLIWTRSGSLSSRCHSSSSRSVPVDSKATVDESQQIKGTALCYPAGDAADCLASSSTSGEAPTSKKARLGWGQGLAKYEKKIVDKPHGCGKLNDIQCSKVGDKCTSPATPTSATCSSSPDKEYKSLKEGNALDSSKLGNSDSTPSNFENLDVSFITDEVHLLLNTIHSDDQSPTGSGHESANAMSKLLLWKTGILKAVEMTDSEIESLESKFQSSKSENRSDIPCPAASSSLDVNGGTQRKKNITIGSEGVIPMPIQVASSKVRSDIDSPETATSNPGVLSLNSSHMMVDLTYNEEICCFGTSCGVDTPEHCNDDPVRPNNDTLDIDESRLCEFIVAANKEVVSKTYDELAQLLSKSGTSVVICQESPNHTLIREEFAKRKKLLRFTERAVTLKYRALQQLWKEDARLLEIRKNRSKSSKRLELGTRTSQSAHLKSNLLRSRASSNEGSTKLVPSSQTVCLTSNLLSDIPIKVYKDELKMPPLILDEKEKQMSRFVSYNGLVEDPVAVEKERAVMNPWTSDEKETFLDKYAIFGKDFRIIASYLDHKTTADCVEFYYKNHKSALFERTRKKPVRLGTQSKSIPKAAYMLTSGGEKWDQERVAADVLAGISCAISSEPISPCVSSSFNHADVHRQWKRKKVGGKRKRTWSQEVTPNIDETCSGESCGEMDFSALDWTDEEKHMLLRAVKLYGNNFELVSKFVKTRYSYECKAFYSKVKKRLGSNLTATNINTVGIRLDNKPDIDVRLASPLLEPVL